MKKLEALPLAEGVQFSEALATLNEFFDVRITQTSEGVKENKVRMSLAGDDIYKRQAVFEAMANSISLVAKYYDVDKEEQEKSIIVGIFADILSLISSEFVYTEWKDGYGKVVKTNKNETQSLLLGTIGAYAIALEYIINKFGQSQKSQVRYLFDLAINSWEVARETPPANAAIKNQANEHITMLHKQIREFEPEHEVPTFQEVKTGGGCYVATAVYGSYDYPQVCTLRRYRDNTLAKTWYGRAFIHLY